MICPNCSTENAETNQFCVKCGYGLHNNTRFVYSKSSKERGIALILEILPGLFGFYGIGWIYSGKTMTGVILLGVGLLLIFIYGVSAIFTAGSACLCAIPTNMIAVLLSGIFLNSYTKEHTELFGV